MATALHKPGVLFTVMFDGQVTVGVSLSITVTVNEQLLAVYWKSIDPTTTDRQFCDVGSPYRTAIFATDDGQLQAARASLAALQKSKPFKAAIVTPIERAGPFYRAEDYHQDYYLKNPVRYKYYRLSCGRDNRLAELWGPARH